MTNGKQRVDSQVDIVVLNWNEGEETLGCLEQLVKIDYPKYRIIVADNGSQDGSVDAFLAFSESEKIRFRRLGINELKASAGVVSRVTEGQGCVEIIVIENGENLGFAGGVNSGMLLSQLEQQAKYVLLLNNDVLVSQGFLLALVEAAEARPEVGIVGGKIFWQGRENTMWYGGGKVSLLRGCGYISFGHGKQDDGTWDREGLTGFVTGAMMLIRLEVLDKIGLLDPRFFFGGEDADFCLRAKKHGYKIYYTPRAVIFHKSTAYQYDSGTLQRMAYVYTGKALLWFKHLPAYIAWPLFLVFLAYGWLIAPYRQAWTAKQHNAILSPNKFRSNFYQAVKTALNSLRSPIG